MAETLMEWFLAAMLHDIGKTLISPRGWWDSHANLQNAQSGGVGFADLLTSEMIARISTHETHDEDVKGKRKQRKFPRDTIEESALVMADQLQKAMYESMTKSGGTLERLVTENFSSAHLNPKFFPYYGQPITWEQKRSEKFAAEIAAIMRQWKKQPTLSDVLALEKKLVHSAHTTNIPHNSLAFHQRFTAIFFYLLYRQLVQLNSVYDWRKLDFAVATIKPDPLSLFYRLKDVRAHETAVRDRLRGGVFECVFKQYTNDLPQITMDANPFEFFGRDALVVVVKNPRALCVALKRILDADESESLRHLTISIVRFSIRAPEKWESERKWDYVPPRNVTRTPSEGDEAHHLLSKRAAKFTISATPRCERCGQPLSPIEATRGAWCTPCVKLLDQTASVAEQLETLGDKSERRGFVFLNLAPLHEEVQTRAEDFFTAFKKDQTRFGNPKPDATTEHIAEVMECLKPTPTGIFEYLQAVMEMQTFQDDVAAHSNGVYPLIQFPELMIWVTSESAYWDFVTRLGEQLKNLNLRHSLSGILCHPRTPFWSLMDRLTKFTQQEGVYQRGEFYDLSGGEVMVFSDDEVKAIRDLARAAFSDQAFKSQLNALVQLARAASLRELEMEIDERDNLRKLRSDFCRDLKIALNRISGDDQKTRDKRALFIKNIVRLAGFGAERRR